MTDKGLICIYFDVHKCVRKRFISHIVKIFNVESMLNWLIISKSIIFDFWIWRAKKHGFILLIYPAKQEETPTFARIANAHLFHGVVASVTRIAANFLEEL